VPPHHNTDLLWFTSCVNIRDYKNSDVY